MCDTLLVGSLCGVYCCVLIECLVDWSACDCCVLVAYLVRWYLCVFVWVDCVVAQLGLACVCQCLCRVVGWRFCADVYWFGVGSLGGWMAG